MIDTLRLTAEAAKGMLENALKAARYRSGALAFPRI